MYRAVTPLIQAGALRVEHQLTHWRRNMIVLSGGGGVRVMLNADPDNIRVFVCAGHDDELPWFELKSVVRAIGLKRPDWIEGPLPEGGDFEWASAAEIGDSLARHWAVLKKLGDPDFPPLEGLQSEYVEWRLPKEM
jgi:hypothetical protein